MPCKVILFYNLTSRGFSETFYTNDASPPPDLSQPAWVNFLTASIALRASPAVIQAVRITPLDADYFPNGLAQLYNTSLTYASASWNNLSSGLLPDPTSTDAVFRLTAVGRVAQRRIFVRGLPDAWVNRDADGDDTLVGTFRTAFNRYFTAAALLGLQIRYQSRVNTGINAPVVVTSVQADANNPHYSVLTLNAASGYVLPGRIVILSRGIPFDDLPGFPRRAKVVALSNINPFSVTIPYRFRNVAPVTPPNMRIQLVPYASANIIPPPTSGGIGGWEFERFSEHKTGRAFGSLRGRSRSLVRAQ